MFLSICWWIKARSLIGVNSKLKKCKNHPIKRHFILKYSCKIFNIGRVSTVECKNSIGLANMQVIQKKNIVSYDRLRPLPNSW